MNLDTLLDVPELTKEDETLLKEIFSHPVVVKYLEMFIKKAVLAIATAGITDTENAEAYVRKVLFNKGSLSVLSELLSIAPPK